MLRKIVIIGPESTGKSTLCEMLAQHYATEWCPEFAREWLLTNGRDYQYDDLLTIAKGQIALEEEYSRKVGSRESGAGRREDAKSESPEDRKTESRESGVGRRESEDGKTGSEEGGFSKTATTNTNDATPDFRTFGLSDSSPLLFLDTDMQVMKVWCEYVFGDCHTWILNRIAERPYDLYLLCKPDLPWVQDELREYPDEKPRQELYHIYRDMLIQQHTPWVEISGGYEERLQKAVQAVDGVLGW